MLDNSKKNVFKNFIWRFLERIGAQAVTLLVSVVLARILTPSDYGTVALITIIINILTIFVDSGLSTALIQKKDADDLDFSSVFYGQMLLCIVVYVLLFIGAPLFSGFYNKPEMTPMIRTLGITLIIAGVKNVQTAYVSRNLIFQKFFWATLGGTIGSAFLGIWLALNNAGPWALVVQSVFNNAVDTAILWFIVNWRPKKLFSLTRLRKLFSYGWKLLISGLLDTCFENAKSLFIGKLYTPENLAFYEQGNKYPYAIIGNINTSIDSVLLPTMSAEQDHKERVRTMTCKAIKTGTYIVAPVLVGLAACAEPLFRFLLTEKWLPIVPYLIIFCLGYIFYPIHTANLNAIKAMGRSDSFLKLEILKKLLGIVLLVITVPIGPMAICVSTLVASIICLIINTWPNKKLIEYGLFGQLKDVFPTIVLSLFMGVCIYWFKYLRIPDFLIVLIQLGVGILIYIGGTVVLRIDTLSYIKSLVWERKRK